jgi:NAD(P)-dependent dehydrogenase (short-subunit alcohol dehydrogenase family)
MFTPLLQSAGRMEANAPMSTMSGKVALVTGGSAGIGRAAALAFARSGAQVVIASRHQPTAEAALQALQAAGGEALWVPTDLTDATQVQTLVHRTVATYGRLDYAFNNGGSGGRRRPAAEMDEADWDATIAGYLKSTWLCMKCEIPVMIKQGEGVIVNNASVDGLRGFPFPGGSAYAAAKHGVLGLTKSAAREYIGQGVRINAICPGWIRTAPVERRMGSSPEVAQEILRQEPIGRLGTPEEVAEAVLWLCSEKASFVVGSCMAVDGGYLA